jgi:hypothetical protein
LALSTFANLSFNSSEYVLKRKVYSSRLLSSIYSTGSSFFSTTASGKPGLVVRRSGLIIKAFYLFKASNFRSLESA